MLTSEKRPAFVCAENEIKQQHNHHKQLLVPACTGTPHTHHSTAAVTVLHGEHEEQEEGQDTALVAKLLSDLF